MAHLLESLYLNYTPIFMLFLFGSVIINIFMLKETYFKIKNCPSKKEVEEMISSQIDVKITQIDAKMEVIDERLKSISKELGFITRNARITFENQT